MRLLNSTIVSYLIVTFGGITAKGGGVSFDGEHSTLYLAVSIQYRCVTDGQTDRPVDWFRMEANTN